MSSPYFRFFIVNFKAERIQPCQCVQKGVCELTNSYIKFMSQQSIIIQIVAVNFAKRYFYPILSRLIILIFKAHCIRDSLLQKLRIRQRQNIMKRKSSFTRIPDWLKVYHPGKITVNNPEFHYYMARTEKDQPVTLYVVDDQNVRPIKMYYNVEGFEEYHRGLDCKDQTDIKSFGSSNQIQEDESGRITINKEQLINQSSWVIKYEPKRFIDLLTDELHNRNVLTWLKSWDQIVFKKTHKIDTVHSFFKKSAGKSNFNSYFQQEFSYKKLILLAGPPGCGKTTLARVIAKHCGYHCQQINASDDRSGRVLISKIDNMVSNNTIRTEQKPVCIVIDQVDGALDSDSNGIREVLNYLETGVVPGEIGKIKKEKVEKGVSKGKQTKDSKQQNKKEQRPYKGYNPYRKQEGKPQQTRKTKIDRPVIFICNNPYVKGLKELRSKAIIVYFNTLNEDRVVRRLKQITQLEKVYIESEILSKICQICNNDVRSSVGVLQLLIKLKRQNNQSAKELISKMRLSFAKDSASSINEFLSKVMQTQNKLSTQVDMFKTYRYFLSQNDNPSLLSITFHHNLLNNRNIFMKMQSLTRLYREIISSDILTKESFTFHGQLDEFHILPYLYFRINFKSEENKKIEFPSAYFQRFNKQKSNLNLAEKLLKQIPKNCIPFVSFKSLILYYIYLFWLTMQTASNKQQEILKCVYKMLTYGIKLNHRNSPFLFNPEIDNLLTFGSNKPEIQLSHTSRHLIQENYDFLKMKSQLLGEGFMENSKQNLQNVINQLKKNRRRKRDSQNGQVKYKYLEGTGTEIKYDLKLGYFFEPKIVG